MTLQDAINIFGNAALTGLLDDERNFDLRNIRQAAGVIASEARLSELAGMSDEAYALYTRSLQCRVDRHMADVRLDAFSRQMREAEERAEYIYYGRY